MGRGRLFRRAWRARASGVVVAVAAFGLVMPAAQAGLPVVPAERYIVMLDPAAGDAQGVALDQTQRIGASVGTVFGAVKGYTATLRPAGLAALHWRTSDTATQTQSGTSMAAPFTAGVAALYLDANPGRTPADVEAALLALSQQSAPVGNSRTAADHSHVVFTGGAVSGL